MTAEIITIGDEILIGQVVDTNSAFIGVQLNLNGISVKQITSISDSKEHILSALKEAKSRADIIIITGGLGPTKDDMTKRTLCEYFNTTLVINEDVLKHVESFFIKRNKPFTEMNKMQAEVPMNCKVLHNQSGTAPGMWFEEDGKIYVSMPGVPYEMKSILVEHVLPNLKAKYKLPAVFHKTVLTQGLGESFLAQMIEEWEDSLAKDEIKLAYLPSPGMVRLRLSIYGKNSETIQPKVEEAIVKLQAIIPDFIYGYEEFGKEAPGIENIIGELLLKDKKTISLAESCTGGYISHLITSVAGSSAYFNGTVVPYHNEFKHQLLEVDSNIFTTAGAVSEVCVLAMVKGAKKKFKSDYAIATSGIAGPAGGTPEKPVGTVWIAVSGPNETVAEKFVFGDDRRRNIHVTALTALGMLRKMMS